VRRFKGTHEDLLKWLKDIPKPAAVFAANDHRAADVLRTCANGGVRVPDDLAVLGVDDDPIFCVHTRPTLSSIHPDFEAEGYAAAQAMSNLLARRATRRRISVQGEPTVTERVSTAPCSPAGRLVRRVDDLIAEHSKEILNSDMIADALGISRRLLDLRYREVRKTSVFADILATRLAAVRRELRNSRTPIGKITKSCGFNDPASLKRLFKNRYGLSMRAYREQG
jgi:LacI family transcriptional regulator